MIAAIAQLATEHGKYSPYPEDTCDRNPDQTSVRYTPFVPTGTGANDTTAPSSVAPTTTLPGAAGADDAANIEACGGTTDMSNFPSVRPGIGNADQDQGLGPFLIVPGALDGTNVDPNLIERVGSAEDPQSATMFIAQQLHRILPPDDRRRGLGPTDPGRRPRRRGRRGVRQQVLVDRRLTPADHRSAERHMHHTTGRWRSRLGQRSDRLDVALRGPSRCQDLHLHVARYRTRTFRRRSVP